MPTRAPPRPSFVGRGGRLNTVDLPDTVQLNSHMEKNRLEAFSDGVLAIIMTVMVLDLKVPQICRSLGSALWPFP